MAAVCEGTVQPTTTNGDERQAAPPGAFRNAHLVSPYWAIESYRTASDWHKRWCRPSKSRRLAKLRAKLADVRRRMGLVEQPAYFDRQVAAVLGPWPLPEPRAPRAPIPAPRNPLLTMVRCAACRPTAGERGWTATWYFRTELARREPLTPFYERGVLA